MYGLSSIKTLSCLWAVCRQVYSKHKREIEVLLFDVQACSDKLLREMEDFGCPPVFPTEVVQKKEEKEEPTIKDKAKGKKVNGL